MTRETERSRVRTDFATLPTLTTERLVLREMTLADAEAWFDVWGDERIAGQTDVETFTNVHQAEALIRWWDERRKAGIGFRWAVTLKPEDRLIGSCGLHAIDAGAARAEIGYELAHIYWRQGLMSEAVARVVQFGFETMWLHRIEALVNVGNEASARLLESVGFREEGIRRGYAFFRDAFHDQQCFAIVQGDAHAS